MRELAIVMLCALVAGCEEDNPNTVRHVYILNVSGFVRLPTTEVWPLGGGFYFETGRSSPPVNRGGMGCACRLTGSCDAEPTTGDCTMCRDNPVTPADETGRCVKLLDTYADITPSVAFVCPVAGFGTGGELVVAAPYAEWNVVVLGGATLDVHLTAPLPADTWCTIELRTTVSTTDPTPLVSEPVAFRTASPDVWIEWVGMLPRKLTFNVRVDHEMLRGAITLRRADGGAALPMELLVDERLSEVQLSYPEELAPGNYEVTISDAVTDGFGTALRPRVVPFSVP